MNIKTQADWWKLAEQTIPKIYDYVSSLFPIDYDGLPSLEMRIEEANNYLKDRNVEKLHNWFEGLWAALPDRPEFVLDFF